LPQVIGSGAALFDYDNDGRLDILLLNNGGPGSKATNRLYHQGRDGKFTDVSAGSGLDIGGYCMGVAIGDVNNDGWPDVLVTQFGGIKLFLNRGDGTFVDRTREAGLDSVLWGTSASFVDYDRDGWLDLVVVNYVDYNPAMKCTNSAGKQDYCHPAKFVGSVTTLYHNLGRGPGSNGPSVRFEDVTVKSGLGRLPARGLGVVCADFNGDGWPDILVASDAQANQLWINQHNGTFSEEAIPRGLAYNGLGAPQGNMGIALGDVSGDGAFDVFITHLTEENNTLWKQDRNGLFRDETAAAGLTASRWRGTGFGTVLADFDLDGALDLALVNGRVSRREQGLGARSQGSGKQGADAPRSPSPLTPDPSFWGPYAERNQLFANEGGGRFCDISEENGAFCGAAAVSRGLACGDVDGDGALDLLVTNVAGRARLYRNVAPRRGHWLILRAIDPQLHRDAYGAVITVQAGNRRRQRLLNPGSSYLCSHDPRVHFGLGEAEQVDAITVLWPDGIQEEFSGQAADHSIVLRKGEGRFSKKTP
jgi:hypothetical protein